MDVMGSTSDAEVAHHCHCMRCQFVVYEGDIQECLGFCDSY